MKEPVYIALLRGINVSGQKIIKMTSLKESFEALGLKEVRTYVQSGNVIFRAPKKTLESLSQIIQKQILNDFGFSIYINIQSSVEISKAIKKNPFLREKSIDLTRLYLTFLSQRPKPSESKLLENLRVEADRYSCSDKVVYLYCPTGYGRSKLNNNNIERVLGLNATTRNWNTVNKLYEMALE